MLSDRKGFGTALLQRSRALLSAESRYAAPCQDADLLASTEPRAFERGERNARLYVPRSFSGLQRSRALLSAESTHGLFQCHSPCRASTEPRAFERGETLLLPLSHCWLRGFNGAARF